MTLDVHKLTIMILVDHDYVGGGQSKVICLEQHDILENPSRLRAAA